LQISNREGDKEEKLQTAALKTPIEQSFYENKGEQIAKEANSTDVVSSMPRVRGRKA